MSARRDIGRLLGRVVGVVALDRRGEATSGRPHRRARHAADERVVDAEVAALALEALLRRPGPRRAPCAG
jgi:hypothetical protein